MMREEVLKELELWPVWRLRQPMPQLETAAVTQENVPAVQEALTVPSEENASIAQQASQFFCLQDEAANCVVLHEDKDFSEQEETLWRNICKAMQFSTTGVMQRTNLSALLENQAPKVIIIFGEALAQTLLSSAEPISARAEKTYTMKSTPCVVTFNLSHLLQNPLDKGLAWRSLCQALALLA